MRNELHCVREHVAVSPAAADGDVASLARRKIESAKQVPFAAIGLKVNHDCLGAIIGLHGEWCVGGVVRIRIIAMPFIHVIHTGVLDVGCPCGGAGGIAGGGAAGIGGAVLEVITAGGLCPIACGLKAGVAVVYDDFVGGS